MAHAKLVAMAVLVVILLHTSTPAVAARSSPALTTSEFDELPAVMTENDFSVGEPSECDGRHHDNNEMLAALSTGSYAGGRRCGKMIRIKSKQNGRTVEARVVDECDTRRGCKDNIVDTSSAVWKALGLDINIGEVPVTWSDAGNHASTGE